MCGLLTHGTSIITRRVKKRQYEAEQRSLYKKKYTICICMPYIIITICSDSGSKGARPKERGMVIMLLVFVLAFIGGGASMVGRSHRQYVFNLQFSFQKSTAGHHFTTFFVPPFRIFTRSEKDFVSG